MKAIREALSCCFHPKTSENKEELPFEVKRIHAKAGLLVLSTRQLQRDLTNITAQQIPRVLAGKPHYPLVFLKAQDQAMFQAVSQVVKSLPEVKVTSEVGRLARAFQQALDTPSVLASQLTAGDFQKLYIFGHTVAGQSSMQVAGEVFSAAQIVDALEQSGLLSYVKDLRFTACESADQRPLASFDTADLKAARRSKIKHSRCLIDAVAHELWQRGHHQVTVTGYHGNGVAVGENLQATTHLRSLTVPATEVVRRSDYCYQRYFCCKAANAASNCCKRASKP